jgi:hypothetical protein
MADDLVLVPWERARALLAGREHTMTLLAPHYPAEGEGEVRVLRVRETGGPLEIVCGYERYRRTGTA